MTREKKRKELGGKVSIFLHYGHIGSTEGKQCYSNVTKWILCLPPDFRAAMLSDNLISVQAIAAHSRTSG